MNNRLLDVEMCRSRIWEAILDTLEPCTGVYDTEDMNPADAEALIAAVGAVMDIVDAITKR